MIICIYAEPMTIFTSGTPMRGLFKELIKQRSNDHFKIILRNPIPNYLNNYFKLLNDLTNCEITYEKNSRKLTNALALIGYKNYNKINIDCDLYISAGTPDTIPTNKIPQIVMLADLSSIRTPKYSSLKWHGKLIFKNVLYFAIKRANKIVCISNFTRNDLINVYPETYKYTEVVYNGIENFWFDNFYENFEELKNKFHLPDKYWIWWGYITNRKNIWNLLKGYQSLINEGHKLHNLLIIGNFAPNQVFIKDFIKKNLSKRVQHIPFQSNYILKTLVKKSNGLLFPSYYEGFGLPIIEAYSQGKNVLYSKVSALPEITNGLGISCNPYDIESIKNGILNMLTQLNQPDMIYKRKEWAAKFNYKVAAQKFSNIIDELMAEKK